MIVKKIISHVYAGILKGFALSMTIPLIISVIKGDGIFHPVSPELTHSIQSGETRRGHSIKRHFSSD